MLLSLLILWLCSTEGNSTGIKSRELNKGDVRLLLRLHNDLRAKAAAGLIQGQPLAGNMRKLAWNKKLAKKASNWAGQCHLKHRPTGTDRHPDNLCGFDGFGQIGENIYASTLRNPLNDSAKAFRGLLNRGLDVWFKEFEDFGFPRSCRPGKDCGHYTQLIWAESKMVGCGMAVCEGITEFEPIRSFILVCNYAPGGNLVLKGKKLAPYEVGDPCSSCPSVSPKCMGGLCIGSRKERCADVNVKHCKFFKTLEPSFCDPCSGYSLQAQMQCNATCNYCKKLH